jgi:dihydroflavonol-4-reductase
MRVTVAGATGFLGSHVVRALREGGHEVRALVRPGRPRAHVVELGASLFEGDLTDEKTLHAACDGVDAVINAAGLTSLWSRHDKEQWRVNVDGWAALIRAATARSVKRIVHVSSTAAIGATRDGGVLDETARWIGPVHRIHYVNTKKEAEERAHAAAWAGLDLVIVNPSMLVGPRLDGRPPSSLLVRVASGRARWCPPGGVAVVDVEDAAHGCVLALERGRAGERYILAAHNLRWRELYTAITRVAGTASTFIDVPRAALPLLDFGATTLDLLGASRPRFAPEIFRSWGWTGFYDSSKAQRELGWKFRVLDATLARTLAAAPALGANAPALASRPA